MTREATASSVPARFDLSSEWRSGWRVAAAGLIGTTTANLYAGALGAMMPTLAAQFGWTRAQMSASVMIVCAGLLPGGVIASFVINRFGLRPVALAGVVFYSIALAAVGLSGPRLWTWYLAWSLVALANPYVNNLIWTDAINRSFALQRGFALSIGLSGVGLGNLIAPLFAAWASGRVGWRGVFLCLGLIALAVGFPAIWILFRVPRDSSRASTVSPSLPTDPRPSRFIADLTFWRLASAALLAAAGIGTLAIHLQPMMRDCGVDLRTGAMIAGCLGPATIVGRLTGGWLLDRLPARRVAGAAFLLPAISCGLLLLHRSTLPPNIAAALTTGLSIGVEGDVIAYLTAQYFGLENYGTAYAWVFGLFAVGGGVGPGIAGAVFDAYGNYAPMLETLVVALPCSALAIASLGPARIMTFRSDLGGQHK